MTTPTEFLERVGTAIDEAADTLKGIPEAGREAWLIRFEFRLAVQWREVFDDFLSIEDVDGMVAEVIEKVQSRLAQIESVDPVTLH